MKKWNNIFLQGLVGLGLVGYNTVKTLIDELEAKPIKDYAEFFPNLSLIDNGKIENQCVRIFEKSNKDNHFLIMNGPQPRSDEISTLFLKQIMEDVDKINKDNKIDVYLSFGAYVNKNLAPFEQIEENKKLSEDELAELVLKHENEKERKLYIATSGYDFDKFIKTIGITEEEVMKESQGYISGLNGVLPAMIGERLKIPTATIMIETTGTESRSGTFPILAQYLGFLSTKRALQFLNKTFVLGLDIETKISKLLEEIKDSAKQELIQYIQKDIREEKREEPDHGAMYV